MATINSISNKIANNSFTIGNSDAGATASNTTFNKDRTGGVITTGDALGQIKFAGHDGTGYIIGSQITSTNSGTVATNRIASDLKMYTHPDAATGSAGSLLRMTIDSAGAITMAKADTGTTLTITDGGMLISAGGLTVTAGSTTLTPLNAAGYVVNNASGVLSTAATTQYTLQVGGATGAFSSLTVGTQYQYMQSSGGGANPGWSTSTLLAATSGAVATGDILAATGSDVIGVIAGTTATSTYVLTGNGSGVLPSWQAPAAGGMVWAANANASITLAINTGYILTHTSLQTCTLPVTAAVGSIIGIVGQGTGLWKIAQNASQYINFAGSVTTTGTGGYLSSNNANDCVELICVVANNGWTVRSSVNNITFN
jgi:hypothetical protein